MGYPMLFTKHTRFTVSVVGRMVQGKFQRLAWRLISNSTIWRIWLLRNKIVFEEGTISFFYCFSSILHRVAIWLYILDSNFTYIENDLLRSPDDIKLWCNKKSLEVSLFFIVWDRFFFFFLSLFFSFLFVMSLYFTLAIGFMAFSIYSQWLLKKTIKL